MSNEFVKEFYTLFQGHLDMRAAFYFAVKTYIESREKWVGPDSKKTWFSSDTTKKNIKIMKEILTIVESENMNSMPEHLNPKKSELSNGKARELIIAFLAALKADDTVACCCCKKDSDKFERCIICNNLVCLPHMRPIDHNKFLQLPRLKNNYDKKSKICVQCSMFLKYNISIMDKFLSKIYPRYKYFILGQTHERGEFVGTGFLYQLINNWYLKNTNTVAFVEVFFEGEGNKYKNYTDNDKAKEVFINQLGKFNNQHFDVNNGIANVLEQYTANKAVYFTRSPEIKALQSVCKINQVPLYTFDNQATDGGNDKDWHIKRQMGNELVAKRIIKEASRHPEAKVFIPIGADHIKGEYALQQYLPDSCGIDCILGNPAIIRCSNSTRLSPQYQIKWPNLFQFPFLPPTVN